MPTPLSSAISAYANTVTQGAKPGLAAPGADGPSFGELLKAAADESLHTLHRGEQLTAAGVVGKADLTDVVSAVGNAEITLQAVTSVRDRVISAYQEILRMPI